jgi:HK97 family phage prohead protease
MVTKAKPTATHNTRVMEIAEARAVAGGMHEITIAANNVARDNIDLDIATLRMDNFRRNPVVLWAHDRKMPPIGVTDEIWNDDEGRLHARFHFADDPFAQRIASLWDQGIIRAASISWGGGDISFPDTGPWIRETNAELYEWSLVPIGSDPDALRSAARGLGITMRELAGMGNGRRREIEEDIAALQGQVAALTAKEEELEARVEEIAAKEEELEAQVEALTSEEADDSDNEPSDEEERKLAGLAAELEALTASIKGMK